MGFAEIKAMSRRAVHQAFAVPCQYRGPGGIASIDLTARLHTKTVVGGDLQGGGYSTVIEGVTRAVFNREELALRGVTLRKRGRVTFPAYGTTLELDVRDPYEGSITERWSVAPL